jgi:hypothetical protein
MWNPRRRENEMHRHDHKPSPGQSFLQRHQRPESDRASKRRDKMTKPEKGLHPTWVVVPFVWDEPDGMTQ